MSETPNTQWIGTSKRIFRNTLRQLLAILLWLIFLSVVFSRLLNSCAPGFNRHSALSDIDSATSLTLATAPVKQTANRKDPLPAAKLIDVSSDKNQAVLLALDTHKAIAQANSANGTYQGVIHRYPFESRQNKVVAWEDDRSSSTAIDSDSADKHVQIATGYYFGSIRRVDINDLPLPEKLEPAYLDTLIQQPTRSHANKPERKSIHSGKTHHTVFSGVLYRKDSDKTTFDAGLEYRSSTQTANAGNVRVNIVALNEDNDHEQSSLSGTTQSAQKGLRRANIEQLNLPLTENMVMDNILGTHRSTRYRFLGSNRATINQRFILSSPDILGVTTRVRSDHHAISLSMGEIGELGGSFLTGFRGLDQELYRIQYDYASPGFGFSTEAWNTTGNALRKENRNGARINVASKLSDALEIQATIAQSENNLATLIDLFAGEDSSTRQELGLYYFDPEFTWINTSIGNDSLGAFYRLQGRWFASDVSFNTEYRRNGLSGSSANKSNIHFSSLSINHRLSRRFRASAYYSFRHNDDKGDNAFDNTGHEHNLRALTVLQHRSDSASTYGVNYKAQEKVSSENHFIQISYDWRKRFSNDNSFSISLEASR